MAGGVDIECQSGQIGSFDFGNAIVAGCAILDYASTL